MSMFLGIIGAVGTLVFIAVALFRLIAKRGNAKKYFKYAGIAFVVFVVGVSTTEVEEDVPAVTEAVAETPKAEADTKPTEEEKAAEKVAAEEEKAKQEAEEKAKAEAEEKAAAEREKEEAEEAAKSLDAEGISMEEFNQIQNGMSYEEVVKIIGVEGEILSETGTKGDQFYTVLFNFPGETGLGANANMMFQGGKLNSKAQFGLE